MANCNELRIARRRLSKIRCVQECIDSFQHNKPLPNALCYVPKELECRINKYWGVSVYAEPSKDSTKVIELALTPNSKLLVAGDQHYNSHGQWCKVLKTSLKVDDHYKETLFNEDRWLLLFGGKTTSDDNAFFTLSAPTTQSTVSKQQASHSWEDAVVHDYALQLENTSRMVPPDVNAVEKLKEMPPNWTLDHDEDLATFLSGHVEVDNENLGSIKNYVESIDVSSFCEDDGVENMTDGDPDTYWESDGSQGQHWIRLKMKKSTIVKKLLLTIDANDDNYMPYQIIVMGGEMDNLKKLNDLYVDQSMYGVNDVCVLEDQKEHHTVIEIRIKSCKDEGIDTRIHGIKIKSSRGKDLGLNKDFFSAENLVRYPKLECFDPEILYRRSILLQRFVSLLDTILPYVVPTWDFSISSFNSLEIVRQFLVLSKKRLMLIETFLRESETCRPSRMPKLYINRRTAAEHRTDPSQDPECKNSVFNQIYEGLKPRDRYEKPLDYRWPTRYDQWWECKFLSEGIIDQGGGFRDSLSDTADELNPVSADAPVPLPFFIRSPNQNQVDANVNRDAYIPNPSCKLAEKYEWIGKLMGACLRGKESLVLALPPFVWKKLVGERVRWSRDFVSVDESEVKMVDHMEQMDEEEFDAYFADSRTWTTTLSDGTTVHLKPEVGADVAVSYSDRLEYAKLVQETRMNECNEQMEWMRRGLLSVIPQAVLDLLTWQELEKRVCGDPEISVEALKRTTHYEDMEENDTRVKFMWEALTSFSNEDRSRFLRFVTGRRRLPAPLYICPDKGEMIDALPESSTCSNTLYLPHYSNAKVAEEKLRYAAYNCIAIDTDMSPWDE